MPQITSLLNGENINQDHQLTSLTLATLHAGVISGLQVSSGSVAVGKAFVECTRSNGEKIMVLYENTSPISVDTSGNGKIFVRIPQEHIDNGSLNAEDGSNIGRIERASAYPAGNYVPLASVSGGVVSDERQFIEKKEIIQKYSTHLLAPTTGSQWTKIGTFSGPQSARFHMRIIGGSGFTSNSPGHSEIIECVLTLGDETHARNLSGYFVKIFGVNSIIDRVRVVRINSLKWDIFALTNAHIHGSFVEVNHSGTFLPSFQPIGAPNVQGDNIYDITEVVKGMDIAGLPAMTNQPHVYSYFPFQEWNGSNKKVTLENLRKWILPEASNNPVSITASGTQISNVYHLQKPCLTKIHLSHHRGDLYSGNHVRLEFSSNNSTWETKYSFPQVGELYTVLHPGFYRCNTALAWSGYNVHSTATVIFYV